MTTHLAKMGNINHRNGIIGYDFDCVSGIESPQDGLHPDNRLGTAQASRVIPLDAPFILAKRPLSHGSASRQPASTLPAARTR